MPDPYYQDEYVTLYHGDCLEIDEWLTADVLVTDPPYGIAWSSNQMSTLSVPGEQVTIEGDESCNLRDAAIELWGGRPAVVFGSWRIPRPTATKQRLIWHKKQADPGFQTHPFFSVEEEIYLLGGGMLGPPRRNVIETNERRTGANGLSAKIGHPTPKPLDLMEVLISKTVGTVADPFAGSASTLVAAKRLGRRAIGVELEERYCEIAAKRLAQGVLDFGDL